MSRGLIEKNSQLFLFHCEKLANWNKSHEGMRRKVKEVMLRGVLGVAKFGNPALDFGFRMKTVCPPVDHLDLSDVVAVKKRLTVPLTFI